MDSSRSFRGVTSQGNPESQTDKYRESQITGAETSAGTNARLEKLNWNYKIAEGSVKFKFWELNTSGRTRDSSLPILLWVFPPQVQLVSHSQHQRKIPSCFYRGGGEGEKKEAIVKYNRAFCSFNKACCLKKLFYHSLNYWGFVRA